MRARFLVVLGAASVMAGCQFSFGDEESAVKPVWDLRESHTMDDVGWPKDLDSDAYKADPPPGTLTILLPEGVTIDGPFDVSAGRPFSDMGGREIEDLVINYDREPLARTVERASDLVQAWGLDGTRLGEWAARNADGRDNSPGGPTGRTPTRRLGADGPTIALGTRALSDGRAYLTVNVFWSEPGAGGRTFTDGPSGRPG